LNLDPSLEDDKTLSKIKNVKDMEGKTVKVTTFLKNRKRSLSKTSIIVRNKSMKGSIETN